MANRLVPVTLILKKPFIIMRSLFLFLLLLMVHTGFSQKIDSIHAGGGQLQLKYAPIGTQRYIVYFGADDKIKGVWLWERSLTSEEWHGQPALVCRQNWVTSDTGFNQRQLVSAVSSKDFSPLYHSSWNPRTGRDAYNYLPGKVVGADTVADANNKSYLQNLDEPSFNWELDLETFSLLPLAKGKTFAIHFFQPGAKQAPAWYIYKVTGTEKLKTANGQKVDCFKLYTEYANNRGYSTWWISRKTHEVLKMEEHFGKVTRFKIKLAVDQ